MNNKCVLAFSGGLDTSYCARYLQQEKDLEIHSVIINTGGFTKSELDTIESKAYELGVHSHTAIDTVYDFYNNGIKYLIYGNVLRNGNYPLSVSAERVFQAQAIVEYAKNIGAKYIAHGSTGAGNDQVRFDMIFQILYPEAEIITPIRDMQLSRAQEVEYLQANDIDMDWNKAKYSINKGLWGTSIGGEETLTSDQSLPEEAWPSQLKRNDDEVVELQFIEGELRGINAQELDPVQAIQELNNIASEFAIGRDIHIGDTIIGIKGRVGFEAAAPSIIIKAHQLLEKHTLTKWQMQLKAQLGDWYGMFFHEGQFLDPIMRNIEAFLESSQEHVTGKVKVKLSPYKFDLLGISSDYDLMQSKFANYGEDNKAWSADDAKGFIKILGNSLKLWNSIKEKEKTK